MGHGIRLRCRAYSSGARVASIEHWYLLLSAAMLRAIWSQSRLIARWPAVQPSNWHVHAGTMLGANAAAIHFAHPLPATAMLPARSFRYRFGGSGAAIHLARSESTMLQTDAACLHKRGAAFRSVVHTVLLRPPCSLHVPFAADLAAVVQSPKEQNPKAPCFLQSPRARAAVPQSAVEKVFSFSSCSRKTPVILRSCCSLRQSRPLCQWNASCTPLSLGMRWWYTHAHYVCDSDPGIRGVSPHGVASFPPCRLCSLHWCIEHGSLRCVSQSPPVLTLLAQPSTEHISFFFFFFFFHHPPGIPWPWLFLLGKFIQAVFCCCQEDADSAANVLHHVRLACGVRAHGSLRRCLSFHRTRTRPPTATSPPPFYRKDGEEGKSRGFIAFLDVHAGCGGATQPPKEVAL